MTHAFDKNTFMELFFTFYFILQLLRRDEELHGTLMKPKRPRAVVLCPTRELSEQVLDIL